MGNTAKARHRRLRRQWRKPPIRLATPAEFSSPFVHGPVYAITGKMRGARVGFLTDEVRKTLIEMNVSGRFSVSNQAAGHDVPILYDVVGGHHAEAPGRGLSGPQR